MAAQATPAGAAPTAPSKKTVPMTVQVQADAKGGAAAQAWADQLTTTVAARKDSTRPTR